MPKYQMDLMPARFFDLIHNMGIDLKKSKSDSFEKDHE
jgi:hypothetical protein